MAISVIGAASAATTDEGGTFLTSTAVSATGSKITGTFSAGKYLIISKNAAGGAGVIGALTAGGAYAKLGYFQGGGTTLITTSTAYVAFTFLNHDGVVVIKTYDSAGAATINYGGTPWTNSTSSAAYVDNKTAAAYGGGKWVHTMATTSNPSSSSGSNWMVSSDNGANWSTATASGYTNAMPDIAYGNGVFVSSVSSIYYSGATPTYVWTSTNTTTWVQTTLPTATATSQVEFWDGLFYLKGDSGTYFTSPNGYTWTQRSFPEAVSRVAYTGSYYVVNSSATNSRMYYATKISGPWAYTLPAIGNGLLCEGGNNLAIAYSGSNQSYFLSSDGGITWSISTFPENVSQLVRFVGERFYCAFSNGNLYASATGGSGSWTSLGSVNSGNTVKEIAEGNGKLLYLDNGGAAASIKTANSFTIS